MTSETADLHLKQLQCSPTDQDLFARWYCAEYPRFYHYALRITGGQQALAEDLCQDAIVAFVTEGGLQKVSLSVEARAYIYRSILNGHIDLRRKRARETPLDSHLEVTDGGTPLGIVEIEQVLDAAEKHLNSTDQLLLSMVIAGFSLSEIAETCHLGYSAAGTRVHRIRLLIKDLYHGP